MPTRNHDLELQRIVEGVVDSILKAPEEEIDEELRAAGDDPLPEREEKRVRLLAAALYGRPEMEELLAVQLEDIERLPEEEVKSNMRQLAEMWLLEEERENSSEGEE